MAVLGEHLSEETRAKLRLANLGRHPALETRAKMSTAQKGRKHSIEARAKMRASALGRHHTPETCAKMRAAHLGVRCPPRTPEHQAKISAALKGRKFSPEQCAKMVRIFSPEYRAKLSAAQRRRSRESRLGIHPTPETRAKMRAARANRVMPFKDTKPEVAVQTLLRDCGVEFTTHQRIPGLNHRWDVMIESRKVLIEIDGCYWHGCPICKIPKARINKTDIPCTVYATAAGWIVIRIRECEIKAGDFSKLVWSQLRC